MFAPGGGVIKCLIVQQGGHKNIAKVLLEIHDPPLPKKMEAPYLSFVESIESVLEICECIPNTCVVSQGQ